jgi:hypothetical protein
MSDDFDDYHDSQETGDKPKFEFLKIADVAAQQEQTMQRVRDFYALPDESLRKLLHAYRWDDAHALSAYAENPERVSKTLGLEPISAASTARNARTRTFAGHRLTLPRLKQTPLLRRSAKFAWRTSMPSRKRRNCSAAIDFARLAGTNTSKARREIKQNRSCVL